MKYMNGPDWKLGSRGLRFQPRIERALSAFIDRLPPEILSRIGERDKWIELIARNLWARLAPEMGVALPELVIFPAALWPTVANKAKTSDGREYWVEIKPTANQLTLFRVLRGSPTNPVEIQKVFARPLDTAIVLAEKRGKTDYPTLSYFGYGAGVGGGGLNTWVSLLEILHLYGVNLARKGDDLIYLGQNPLAPHVIEDMTQRLRHDIDLRLQGEPPQFFDYSLPDLIRALIGWEIAALAIESLKATAAPKAREGLSEGDLAVLQKTLHAIAQSQPYAVARQMQSVQKGSRVVINSLSSNTRARASDRDLDGHLRDLEEVLDEVDQTVQDKEIPAWLTEHITKFQEAKRALDRATTEDKENFRRSLALFQANALEQLIRTGDRKAARERRMLADKTPGHYRVLLWDAESSLNGLRQSKYTSREEVKREEARVKALAEKADEQDRTLALGSTVKNLNTFVSTLDTRSGGAAYKALTGMINIDGSVMTKAAWITKLVQNGAPLAVNFNALPRKRDESEDDYFDGNEGDTEDTTKVSPEYIIGKADDRYTLGAYGFAFAQYLGAPWVKPPENAIVFDDFAFANAKRMNKAAEQILSSPKYQGFILSAQTAGAKVSPVLLSIAAKG